MNDCARLWVLLSAWLTSTGWILSYFHVLNRIGYLISFALLALMLAAWQLSSGSRSTFPHPWYKPCRRFRRPLPLLFLLVVLFNLLCALVYPPQNGDSNAYRVPRVFHWLGEQGWHWIHTGDSRMNIAGSGYEWLMSPLMLFGRSDRWIFLPNWLSYILLPGLIFSVFRRMGVAARTAWWWMWILAFGWCYVFQSASTLTDSIGVVYALAAVDFALRARESRKVEDIWLAMLATGLLTGVKQTNLPLVLPCVIAMWPNARLLLRHPAGTTLVGIWGILVSAVPLACLNWKYAGSWSGFPRDAAGQVWAWGSHQELTSPFWGLLGNLFCVPAQNLVPFFFPPAGAWNDAMRHFVQTPFGAHFAQFEIFGRLGRSVNEATAGIGLAIILLMIVSMVASRRGASVAESVSEIVSWQRRFLYWTPWLCLLVFMAKVGTYQNARQAAPYYVLLFPAILSGARYAWLARRVWWQRFALMTALLTVVYVGYGRGHPLLPAGVMEQLHERFPRNKIVSSLKYSVDVRLGVSAQKNYLKGKIPADEQTVGYVTTCGGAEPGLWTPFGSRKVKRILPEDQPSDWPRQGIHSLVVEDVALEAAGQTIEQWLARNHCSLVDQLAFPKDPGSPPGHLYLVRVNDVPRTGDPAAN